MKKLATAVRGLVHAAIRHVYWTTDASTHDPLLKEGMQRAWLDGLAAPAFRGTTPPSTDRRANN